MSQLLLVTGSLPSLDGLPGLSYARALAAQPNASRLISRFLPGVDQFNVMMLVDETGDTVDGPFREAGHAVSAGRGFLETTLGQFLIRAVLRSCAIVLADATMADCDPMPTFRTSAEFLDYVSAETLEFYFVNAAYFAAPAA